YRAPARLNDRLDVSVEALDRGASRLIVAQGVLRGAATLAQARIVLACLDRKRWRPARIPAALATALPRAIDVGFSATSAHRLRPSHA
ncbi:MAG TPA: hypothetical protein VFR50_06945, partial [Casimicrobiaceae bacterium]|nr:hypothetical protein [Casimicrobiaceae bacterium]